jgi:endonuclease NucS-like protein
MPDAMRIDPAVAQLRAMWRTYQEEREAAATLIRARDEVLARYQPIFSPEAIPSLSEEVFRDFLLFKNNRHWMALQRKGPLICADMPRLREALRVLLDESRPIEERLDKLVPRGKAFVPHLGKAILTPILLIASPDKYGVWNQISETAMRTLEVWPALDPKLSFGTRFRRVNDVILQLAQGVGVDLWTLDALWWRALTGKTVDAPAPVDEDIETVGPTPTDVPAAGGRFGLEQHLQEFLRDNWEHIGLGRFWKLYEEDGDPEAGFEYRCDVGRIDLLAKHRTEPRWLVIELKRDQTGDKTVGQVLRYMGWVKENLAAQKDLVEGLIIAKDFDEGIRYALRSTPSVRLQLYEVKFKLSEVAE